MLIKCPYCGNRPVDEYTYLGDASKKRPDNSDSSDAKVMDEWHDYVYIRDNIKGRMHENWHHSGGCRAWLVVDRSTETHLIHGVTTAREYSKKGKI